MKRIKLIVQYDGTDFCGWAEQKAARSVQRTLKECIYRATGEIVELRGASRTDSGAHALGQVADFASNLPIEPSKWAQIINRVAPIDLRVSKSSLVHGDFHSRFFARSRTYRYTISELDKVDPMKSRYVYEGGRQLDLAKMRSAARHLIGEHDFRAFGEELENVENAVRSVLVAEIIRKGTELHIMLEANAFIRGMVRRISGGLFEVGRGHRSEGSMVRLLDTSARESEQLPVVLPARGLTLMRVQYGKRLRDLRLDDKGSNCQ